MATTQASTAPRVEFFGLNGWAVVEGAQVVSPQFRTQVEAEQALAKRVWRAKAEAAFLSAAGMEEVA